MAWVQKVVDNSIYTLEGKKLSWEDMFKLKALEIKYCDHCGVECYRLTELFPYVEVKSNLWVEWNEDLGTVLCYRCWSKIW